MRYNKIRKMDISNGPGVRVSIFVQGCTFNCKDCFNPETHSFKGGEPFTNTEINKIIELADRNYICGLSVLGGEPLHPNNIKSVAMLIKCFKETYPNKTIWVWTGFKFEDILERTDTHNIFDYIDVLVDGQFELDNKDIRLKYSGSTNQRVIDINKTRLSDHIVLINNY